jgi:putative ABC transport system permease protein
MASGRDFAGTFFGGPRIHGMSTLAADLRHGARIFLRTPALTVTALLALALAIGANSAMFTVVDAVLLRPLPYEDPSRVVMIWEDASKIGFPRNTPAPANWVDWRAQNTVFTDIAATRGALWNLTGEGIPDRVLGRRVTANLWTILGSRPLLGRTFTEQEDQSDAKVAVIGYGLWQRRFGGDPDVIGRKLLMNNEPFEVIGVMRADFSFPNRRAEVWTPAAFTPQMLGRRGSHFLQCVARLRPGVSLSQAQAEMNVIMRRLQERYPDTNRDIGAVVVPMREQVAGEARLGLIALFSASALLLLLACANVANLLLARAKEREREIAVRSALGASRLVILRQLLTESLLLAVTGAALGLMCARLSLAVLSKLIPTQMPLSVLSTDWRMLAFTAVAALGTAILFGIVPAFSTGRADIQHALKQGGRTSAGGVGRGIREALVISQTAIALALLTGAGLMIQTLNNLGNTDLGLRTEGLLTASTELPQSIYDTHAKQEAFLNSVLDHVRGIPGVVAAGYTSDLPLTATGNTNSYRTRGQALAERQGQDALMRVVSADYFQALGARLREGRFFRESDRPGSEAVALVNETFANRHWPGESSVGKQISTTATREEQWLTVAGAVREIRERGITIGTKPAIYIPLAQSEGYWPVPGDLVVRTTVPPESIVNAVRRAVWAVDQNQPVAEVRTMQGVVDEVLAREHQQTELLSIFALLALMLAATGLYGVIAYAVSQRRREFGVRMALGASSEHVLRLVLGRGVVLIVTGITAGILLSLAAASMAGKLLHGIAATDPVNLMLAASLLGAVAFVACAAPAWAATRVQPSIVLRDE